MSLSYGILGLLNYYPMSGYDLKKTFDDSINFFWTAQTSQIYRELKALEKKGDICSTVEASAKGPHRRIYSITGRGKRSLVEWLENPPDIISEGDRNALAVRILHSSAVGLEKLAPVIRKQMAVYQQELAQLEEVEKRLKIYLERSGQKTHLPYWLIVLNKGRHINKANVAWARETLASIDKSLKKGGS